MAAIWIEDGRAGAVPRVAPPVSHREGRVAYLDRLKAGLVALIIAGHGVLAYGSLDNAWPYQSVQEARLGKVSDTIVDVIVIPVAMFAMGLFFLLSGLVAPGSLARRGPGAYARVRLLRLGVPLLIWTIALWPTAIWLAHAAAGEGHWPGWQLVHDEPFLDTGPMWFVLVLLVFSLIYAGWSARGRRRSPDVAAGAPRSAVAPATLTRVAAAISLLNLLVRPFFPAGGNEFLQIHLWQWPQCVVLFTLGIFAARRGWLDRIPDELMRRASRLALLGLVGFLLVALVLAATGTDGGQIFEGGLHWAALGLALVEGPLAVGASVGLLGLAQRRFAGLPGPVGQAVARSAYGAFVLQGLVLMGLMIVLRPLGLPAEVKAIVVAATGVAGSFGLSCLLVSRTPLGRVL